MNIYDNASFDLQAYKIVDKSQAIRFDDKGTLLVFKPTVGDFKTAETIANCPVPNLEFNKYFYRPKSLYREKVLHETDQLEIIDYKTMFPEEMKQGNIEQYIGDGVIVTILHYHVIEDNTAFLKRVLKELKASLEFWDKHCYERRFYPKEFDLTDHEKEAFTQLVLNNIRKVIHYVEDELK